jgi:hypothetical protein
VSAKSLIGNKLTTAGTAGEITLGTGLALDATTGVLSASGSGGTVTSVSPITITASGNTFTSTVTNGTTAPVISLTMPLANLSGTTAGLLSNADYAIFNAKQSALTLGASVQTFLATPSSANLLSAMTDETGTGNVVFSTNPILTNPTFTTPTLGVATATSLSAGTLSLTTALSVSNGGTGQNTYTTGDLLYAGATNTLNKLPLGTSGQILTSNGTNIAWAPNSSASLSGGVAGALPYQSGVGVTGYTAAGTAGQILTSAGTASAPTWTTIIPVANGGTGAATLTSNAVLLGNGTSAVQTVAPGRTGNVLVSNGTTWVSQAAPASGVSTVGSISATSNIKGATISGTSITLTAADGTNGGVVTTASQTFAGTKTFADVNLSGALNGASSSSSTIAGFNAAITPITSAITISSVNAATYNGKVLVCSGSAFTVTFDSSVPVGFSCMILQSDNNIVSFSGTNNRYNYSSTSGIYAIATAMCYASGAVLLTGDLQ